MKNKKIILMRGISGSGKSTLARKIQSKLGGIILSTDDYFMNDGKYFFDPNKLFENHEKNKSATENAMKEKISPIIIDNMNSKISEMQPYAKLAKKYGYKIYIKQTGDPDFPEVEIDEIMCRQELRSSQNKSFNRNIIESMLAKYQPNITVKDLLESLID